MTACRLRAGTGSEAFSAATSEAVSRRCHSYGKCCGPGGCRDLRAVQPPFHFLKVCVSCLCGFQSGSYDKTAEPSGTQRPGLLWHLLPISYLVPRNWKKKKKPKLSEELLSTGLLVRSHHRSHSRPQVACEASAAIVNT